MMTYMCAVCTMDISHVVVVGGIYTVIKTKAAVSVDELGDQYCLMGPYNESCVRSEVEIMEPYNEAMALTLQQMRDNGIKVCLVLYSFQMFLKFFKIDTYLYKVLFASENI